MSQTSTSVKYPRPLHTHTHTQNKTKKKKTYPIGNKQTEGPDKELPHYDGHWCLFLHLCERLLPRRQRATTAPSSSPTTLAILFILYGRPLQFDVTSSRFNNNRPTTRSRLQRWQPTQRSTMASPLSCMPTILACSLLQCAGRTPRLPILNTSLTRQITMLRHRGESTFRTFLRHTMIHSVHSCGTR